MRRALSALLAVVATVASCSTPAVLEPAVGPGTQYPCGVDGVVWPGAMCCSEGDVCGTGANGCPAGMCCFVGTETVRTLLGKPRPARSAR